LLAATFFTASLNVTVHDTDAAFVGLEPARFMDETVGAVESIDQAYEVAELDLLPDTAEIWKVCDPWASELNTTEPLVVPPQIFATPSRVQVKVTPD
jgi:hypothetical protein